MWPQSKYIMNTSSYGNVFCVIGTLLGEFSGNRWIPLTNGQWCWPLTFFAGGNLNKKSLSHNLFLTLVPKSTYSAVPLLTRSASQIYSRKARHRLPVRERYVVSFISSTLIDILPQFLRWYMQYADILDRVMTTLDCISSLSSVYDLSQNISWTRHVMEMLSALLAICWGSQTVFGGPLHKGSVMQTLAFSYWW